ncbi:MAG: hypothetical protein U9Q83_06130 [Bacteroidota bacterium]|nr:hypothetical protein [Bacteroidota bacterium]
MEKEVIGGSFIMNILTLFSGIGSPEQGAKRVYKEKLNLVSACEWDKFARESFKANYQIEDKHIQTVYA